MAVYGAYHIHTLLSDGSGSVEEVAEAAARAGLSFVIITDHGNGPAHRALCGCPGFDSNADRITQPRFSCWRSMGR